MEQKGSKKIKIEKPVEVEEEELKDEACGKGRRRLGRIAQSQSRCNKKSNRFRVEEVEEESDEANYCLYFMIVLKHFVNTLFHFHQDICGSMFT